MDVIKGYQEIGNYGQEIFDKTHKKHLAAMGESEKEKYGRDQVQFIRANNDEGCLEIGFKNGELFKYTPDMTWH